MRASGRSSTLGPAMIRISRFGKAQHVTLGAKAEVAAAEAEIHRLRAELATALQDSRAGAGQVGHEFPNRLSRIPILFRKQKPSFSKLRIRYHPHACGSSKQVGRTLFSVVKYERKPSESVAESPEGRQKSLQSSRPIPTLISANFFRKKR